MLIFVLKFMKHLYETFSCISVVESLRYARCGW